jgi:EPS-associated MarR family transcriptional regulator
MTQIYYIQQNGRVSKKQNKFQILQSLDQDSHPTQRQLSNDLGISLGKVNYCLKRLIVKGFIKVNNFKNSNNKIQYSYVLTPKGAKEKAKLTLDFIRIKTQEYDTLKQEVVSLKQEAKNMDRDLL